MKSYIFVLILFGYFFRIVAGANKFNYEIGSHTRTAIEGILSKIAFAVDIPADAIAYEKELVIGKLRDVGVMVNYLIDELFAISMVFSKNIQVSSVYLAVEYDGNFVSYATDDTQPNGAIVTITDPSNRYGDSAIKNHMYFINIDRFGYPINIFQPGSAYFNKTYDPRLRPWYTPVKKNPVKQWSPVYIDATSGEPCLTIVQPIFNDTTFGNHTFIGTMALDIYLSGINEFLLSQYQGTDRIVFIIDKDSNVLIGNSLLVPNYIFDSHGSKVSVLVYFIYI